MYLRHVWRLVFRALLLLIAACLFFFNGDKLNFTSIFRQGLGGVFLWIVWLMLVVEMLYRLFPNKSIATGARKHYACSFSAAPCADNGTEDKQKLAKQLNKGALPCALGWVIISAAVLAALYLLEMLTPSAMMIVLLVYAVGDVIFILFFCPFRVLFMHNRCCVVCRIYNWDYFMICAPLIIFPHFYSISLFLLSAAVVVRWEIAYGKNPHYFLEETNENLSCESCKEKICSSQRN